ncbi:MAG: transcriptional repressor [Armatimonadetes bacterium]|nr:transcriptional repressor [Armatimonadota bacterium]
MDDFAAHAEGRLKAAGYRLTRARRVVVAALAQADRALSPYAIIERLRATESGAPPDVVTVYRVLDLLETLDLAHRVHTVNGYVACSRLRVDGCHHHPIICAGCGRIAEIDGHAVEPLTEPLGADGWTITGHVLEFSGLCPECAAAR